jgi:beta-lactamase class A
MFGTGTSKKTVLFCFIFLFAGILIGWFVSGSFPKVKAAAPSLRLKQSDYPLINPLLLCSVDDRVSNEDKDLENNIKNFISLRKEKGLLESMSVYVIDYKNSTWSGVNQNERYDPASMLKVPVMIAYYSQAEKNPKLLAEETSFVGDDQNTDEFFKSKNNIIAGRYYTIDSLIKSMIVNSDNTALILLQNYIDKDYLLNVFTDLGLPLPKDSTNIEYLSAKSYAYFFRILYNATYLDRQYSEKALELLSESNVSIPAIRAGVPEGVKVADKFGERSISDTKGNVYDRELHDCGIVYKEDSPYLLCVMSRSKKDFNTMAKNISDVSALVYQNIK